MTLTGHSAATGFSSRPTPLDLDHDPVAVAQQHLRVAPVADPRRRPGQHHVAGRQRRELGDRRDDRRDVEDEQPRVRVLHPLPVELERDVERVRVADLVGGDEERAERRRARPRLARQPLVRLVLVVAHRDVVGDRVAGDRRQRLVAADAPHAAADHERQLGLVVDGLGLRRQHDRLARADQRVGELREQRRVVGQVVDALVDVRLVVEPDADDLARPRHDRPQRDVRQRELLARQRRVGEQLRRASRRPAPRRRAAAAPRRPRRAPRTGARRASSSRSGSRRGASAMSKSQPRCSPRRSTGRTSAGLTAPIVSFSRYGSSGKKTWVTSVRWPGAVTLKWMCAGRQACWPTASR